MSLRTVFPAAALAVACAAAMPATAQSSLGLQSGGLTFGLTQGEDGEARASADLWADVAIGSHHGVQIDLAAEDTAQGLLAHAGVHLYLAPGPDRKYGVFATVGDLDGESFTVGTVGLEGRMALGPRTGLELRGGIGIANRIAAADNLDFLFAGAAVDHEIAPGLTASLSAEVAEFDETGFQAMGSTVLAEVEYRPARSPLAISAGLGVSSLEGRDGRPQETFARIGVSWTFGAATEPARRPFRRADPYAPLALRGLF
ncbi:MAG: hypothetical protein MUE98_12310 [Rhodobacteraceae bacterium]|jgi:hypothetical protein|nr:hypothetical protein [Paracoccaceae bacterium]